MSNPLSVLNGIYEGLSPFQKNIILGFYDGTTEAISLVLDRAFHIIQIAWDSDQDKRCYSVSEIKPSIFKDMEAFILAREQAKYPNWFIRWHFATDEEKQKAETIIRKIYKSSSIAKWLILGEDISGKIKMITTNDKILLQLEDRKNKNSYDDLILWQHYFQK